MVNFHKKVLILLACLGSSAIVAKKTEETFNVVDEEGKITTSTGARMRGLKVCAEK